MEHIICRCKNCGKTYTYCTYGNGPEWGTEEGCSMDYCGECQTAIDKALEGVGKKFVGRSHEFKEPRVEKLLNEIKEKATKEENERRSKGEIVFGSIMDGRDDFDITETFTHDGVKYWRCWNDDTPEDVHTFLCEEYDLKKKEFTGEPYTTHESISLRDTYRYGRSLVRDMQRTFNKIHEQANPLPGPLGKVFYMEPIFNEWEVVSNNKEKKKEPPKPKHILHTYSYKHKGRWVMAWLERGEYGDRKLKIAKGVDTSGIIPWVQYECSMEKYADEDFETLTNIKAI